MKRILKTSALLGALTLAAPAMADFDKDVLPILEKKCMGCHRAPYKTTTSSGRIRTKKPKGDLRLDSPENVKKGGEQQEEDGKNAITAKDSAKSLLYTLTQLEEGHDDVMPPEGETKPKRLTEEESKAIKDWIDGGADFGKWTGTKFTDEGKKIEE
jgi:hypothetical protein